MVPIPESTYFPPLEKCLSGEELVISWKGTFNLLSLDETSIQNQSKLRSFLSEPYVVQLLAKPFDAFAKATAQTKSAFETKTAAINVTPTTDGRYDIGQIKEDSLWLSKEVDIDEIAALRIVVEEWQTRSASRLLCAFTDEEISTLQAAVDNATDVQLNSTSRALLSGAGGLGTNPETFETQESRRLRIINTYLTERTYILRCAETLLQRCTYSEYIVRRGVVTTTKGEAPWVESVAKNLRESVHLSGRESHIFQANCIKGLRTCVERLVQGSGWFKQDGGRDDVELEFTRTQLAEAIHILELLFQALETAGCIPSAKTVLEWYQVLSEFGYLDQYQAPDSSLQLLVTQLQSLTSVVSLAMLDLSRSLSYLLEPQEMVLPEPDNVEQIPYITSVKTINELHDLFLAAANNATATAGPAVFVWGILLQTMQELSTNRREARELRQSQRAVEGFERESGRRRSSVSSEASLDAGIYEEVLENIMDWDEDGNPIEYLARSAVDGSRLFDVLPILAIHFGTASNTSRLAVIGARMRLIILDVVRSSIASLHYIPEVLSAALAAITGGQQYWDLVDAPKLSATDDPIAVFIQDEYLTESLLHAAISRYPYEQLPFLKMIRAISACSSISDDDGTPIAIKILEKIPTFTFELPGEFRDYTTAQEEENTNTIRLTRSVHLIEDRSSTKVRLHNSLVHVGADDFRIPAGTIGRVISDPDKEKVTIWFHEYSGLRYFGKLLETALTGANTVDATTGGAVDRESATEIIGTFATLLLTISKANEDGDVAVDSGALSHRLLEEASDGLSRNRDIVSVIFDLFEEELQRKSGETGSDEALELLVACVEFIHAVLPILPGRVWPLLSRSSLLDMDGRGGKLSGIIASTELISGHYEFLTSCTKLFNSLVEESVSHAAIRRIGRQSSSRNSKSEELGAGVPNQVLAKVLLSFTRIFLDVLESMPHWRFVMPEERLLLVGVIASTFETILQYAYGDDDSQDLELKITGTLAPSAKHLITNFISTNPDMTFQPILRACLDGFCTPNSTVNLPILQLWIAQVKSILKLSLTLISVATQQELPNSQLSIRLFKISPLLARLYAAHDSFQVLILELFEAIVINASEGESEPPSLLGLLGPRTSKDFLGMLRDLGQPLNHLTHSVAVWNLLAAVVSKRQQWFAIYILTGSTPRESLKVDESKTTPSIEKPIFVAALDTLCDLEQLPPHEALALLRFVALSQNFWPWAMSSLQKHTTFINAISEYLANTKGTLNSTSVVFSAILSSRIRAAAYIAEIMAMFIFHSRQIGDNGPAKKLLSHIGFLVKEAVSVPAYNSSLQGNLKRNFEAKFSGCSLKNFKRTGLVRREYGHEYFYNLTLANRMLHSDQAWTGRKNDGLAVELAKANTNLSLVDSQVALLNSWKYLAVELSCITSKDQSLQKMLATVVADCLKSNMRSQLPETIFNELIQTRANLALSLLQRLVQDGISIPEVRRLLVIVWDAIHGLDSSFGTALASGNAQYYRTLLKMLFLTLCVQTNPVDAIEQAPPTNATSRDEAAKISNNASIIQLSLDIIQRVVAQDFRIIVTAIHDNPANVSPEDIALVTAVLQACLRIPGMEFCHAQIVQNMIVSETARVATTLFSWADKLAVDGDPIYGELSILFLLELSSMSAMAEQLAVDGVLGQISTASLTTYLQKGRASPVAEGSGPQRCYNIWVRGILPILLNLLHAVGSSIAAEVALFLRQFPALLKQSGQALESPDSNRTTSVRSTRPIIYNFVSEANSLALITYILSAFRTSLIGINDIPEVTWDGAGVLEDVEFWLSSRHILRERIVPLGPREVELSRQKPNTSDLECHNRLEEKVVIELLGIRDILAGEEA